MPNVKVFLNRTTFALRPAVTPGNAASRQTPLWDMDHGGIATENVGKNFAPFGAAFRTK